MKTKVNIHWLIKNDCFRYVRELKLFDKLGDVKAICKWLHDNNRTHEACWIIAKLLPDKLLKKYGLYLANNFMKNLSPPNIICYIYYLVLSNPDKNYKEKVMNYGLKLLYGEN
jgi:hypothetical protein